jgi:DNA-3-methyladenine glycosylase I
VDQRNEGLSVAEDGLARCSWAEATSEYRDYHDREWGRPVRGERALFERITLEAFQSGLSWLTILRKRENFREAFARWDPDRVARFGPGEVARLLTDTGIVRNWAKIEATVTNARATVALREQIEGGLDALIWSFAPDPGATTAPRSPRDVPARTTVSTALAKALRRHGFVFVGPTTAYAMMQACGLVDDHLVGCHARAAGDGNQGPSPVRGQR